MELTGTQLIGPYASAEGDATFAGINPQTGEVLPTAFHEATPAEVNAAAQQAELAFPAYRAKSPHQRAQFLDQIAAEILALGDTLLHRAMAETALPLGRLQGERGRTMGQLQLFAEVLREGSWVGARIDPALPGRQPQPRLDIRQMLQPLGPVAVFGASNFPLAFSVAGGDTASALAAGCPVVIKGHPAHPGTSELVARAILAAAHKTGMPEGVCSMVQGTSHSVGVHLVKHPLIQAVGFTGSFRGGKALFDLANQRLVPIPVFAEMGSTNPVFILPGALQERGGQLGVELAGSLTLGVGQFCTNPGLVFLSGAEKKKAFTQALQDQISAGAAGTMLTAGIKAAFVQGAETLQRQPAIQSLAQGQTAPTVSGVAAQVFMTTAEQFLQNPALEEEVFGPSSLLVEAENKAALLAAAKQLGGHLTATIHGTDADFEAYPELFAILERKVGRIVLNGFPTGVEVGHAMVHGGPFPATTAPQSTSVGTLAIQRFARPVCYQNFPESLLPEALRAENPLQIWRLVNGTYSQAAIDRTH